VAVQVERLEVAVGFEEDAEWSSADGGVQLCVPVEHDIADQERAQFGPASADEAVRVYGRVGGVSIDSEVFEVGTARDEHVPETVVSRNGLIC